MLYGSQHILRPGFAEVINTDVAKGKNSLCALRDRFGFIWVGTFTGLYCYDGNGRMVFPSNLGNGHDTEGNGVSTLWEHGDNIWFGGTSGLAIFRRDTNEILTFPRPHPLQCEGHRPRQQNHGRRRPPHLDPHPRPGLFRILISGTPH